MRLDELPSAVVSSPLPEGTKTPRTSMRLDEVVQTSGERVYQKDFDWASLQLSEGEKNALKAKGGIGYFEQSVRMKKMEKAPLAGMAVSAYESAALLRAVHRLQKNDYTKDPNLQVRDAQLVEGAMRYAAEEQIRGFTWGGAVIEGASQLPQYMIGFGLSKFLAKGATAAVTKNVSAKIAEQTANKIIQKAVVGTAVLGTEAAVGSATVFAPGIIAGTLKNEAQLNLIPTDRGYELNRQTQTAPFSSFAKSLGDTYIELFSEGLGGLVFNPVLNRMAGTSFVKPLVEKLSAVYKKLHPSDSLGKLFTKTGWDGFISEIGEEVVGEQIRAITGVNDFGVTDGNVLDRMIAAIPDGDEMMVMMGVLAVPGAMNVAASSPLHGLSALNDYREKKVAAGQTVKPFNKESFAGRLREEGFDPVQTTVEEALQPLPQEILPKEVLEELRLGAKKRDGSIAFDESKPAPDRKVVDEIISTQQFKESDKDTQLSLLIRGRTADLDKQRTVLEDKVDSLEKDVKRLSKSKDPVAQRILEAKKEESNMLVEELMSVHAQISDVIDSSVEELAREDVSLSGNSLNLLRKKARQVGARMERARVETVLKNEKAQAEERRTALVKYLRARLPGPENAKLREKYTLRAAKDMTEEKLQKFFTEIETVRDTVRAKQLRERSEKIVDKMRPTVENGVKKGAFANANIQTLADEIVNVAGMSAPVAEQELQRVHSQIVALSEAGEGTTEAAENLKYRATLLSTISGLEQRNADQMEEAVNFLSRRLAEFQTGRDVVKELRRAQAKAEERNAVAEIKKRTNIPKTNVQKIIQKAGKSISSLYHFSSFHLEEFWRDLGITKMIAEPLARISERTAALQLTMDRQIRAAANAVYGVSPVNNREYMKWLTDRMSLDKSDNVDTAPYLKTVTLNTGAEKNFKLSRFDVMYWYASAYQEQGSVDPEAYETLTGENELQAIREQATSEIEAREESGSPLSEIEVLKQVEDYVFTLDAKAQQIRDEEGNITAIVNPGFPSELKGYTTADIKAVIRNVESGKTLTPKQEAVKKAMLELGDQMGLEGKQGEGEVDIDALVAERAANIKGNAIPAEVLEEIFSTLTEKDRLFAMQMRKIFTSFWPLINPIYARATGVNLTQVESYIPRIKKTASQHSVEDMFTEFSMVEAHVTPFPGSVKERRPTSTAPFAQIGLMDVYMGFRDVMSHWIATHDITVRMQRYLKNRAIRDAINEATDGVQDKATGEWKDGSFVKLMDFHLKGIASRGRSDNTIRPPAMEFLRRNLSRALLSKPKQALVQLTSTFAAIQRIGHVDFVKGMMSFWSDPAGSIALMNKALSLHNRYQNISMEMKEVQDLIRLQKTRFRDKLNWVDKYAFFFTQIGDRAAISMGGWAVFKAKYDKTKSLEESYKAFDDFVYTLQQSALREHQTAATVGPSRYFFQFVSAVAQYGRAYYRSWSDLIREPSKENIQMWARTMVVFHMYIPIAMWSVSQIGLPPPDDEEEEEKRRNKMISMMLTGPFSGLWILGTITDLAAEAMTGEKAFDQGPAVISAMNKSRTQLSSAIQMAMDEDADPEEILSSIFRAEKTTVGLTAGIPAWLNDSVQMLYLHSQGDWEAENTPGLLYGQSMELMNYHNR